MSTRLDLDILRALEESGDAGMSPTLLGHSLDRSYFNSSAAVSRPLRELVAQGSVERVVLDERHNKVVYRITPAGRDRLR